MLFLRGKRLPYPPSAFDILFGFGVRDTFRFAGSFLLACARRLARVAHAPNFEAFTTGKVGRSLYRRFYRPYAWKLYGQSPRGIAQEPAVSRVRKFAPAAMYRGLKKKLRGTRPEYLYPAKGIGQLCEALRQRFLDAGGQLRFISHIDGLTIEGDRTVRAVTCTGRDGRTETLRPRQVVSTIPLDALHRLIALDADRGQPPPFDLRWRALRLLCLITPDRMPSAHETYYFPEPHIPFGRVSEFSKYSPQLNQDPERAALTLGIPCSVGDDTWNQPDDVLAEALPWGVAPARHLPPALDGADGVLLEENPQCLSRLRGGLAEASTASTAASTRLDNLYMIGRTALFLHCNIDHCMAMAVRLAEHLQGGRDDKREWDRVLQGFFDYRVRE